MIRHGIGYPNGEFVVCDTKETFFEKFTAIG